MKIINCLNINQGMENVKLYKYDLKNEIDESIYKHVKKSQVQKVLKAEGLEKFFHYKQLSKSPFNIGFDCDGSGQGNPKHYCVLSREIYRLLWGFDDFDKSKKNIKINRYGLSDFNEKILLGPDTMNTLASTFIHQYNDTDLVNYLRYNLNKNKSQRLSSSLISQGFDIEDKDKKEEFINKLKVNLQVAKQDKLYSLWENFAVYSHTIGNMVLVPKGFNSYRGICSSLKDFWDLSLDCLKWNKGNISDNEFSENFKRYIDFFFLWEYVDDKYEIKPIFESHKQKMGPANFLSQDSVFPLKAELISYLENLEKLVYRRGIFMWGLLLIIEHCGKDTYQEIQKNFILKRRKENYEEIMIKISNHYNNDSMAKICKLVTRELEKLNS